MDWQGSEAESDQPSKQRQYAEAIDDLRNDDAKARAQVADLTASVASQLNEITAEMNRIRAALGSETEIGDIQAELDALRAQLTVDAGDSAAAACAATSARGDLRRRQRPVPTRDDDLDGLDDSAHTGQSWHGLVTSVVIVVLMLSGPLWPLTAQAIASFSSLAKGEQTPWYDQVVT